MFEIIKICFEWPFQVRVLITDTIKSIKKSIEFTVEAEADYPVCLGLSTGTIEDAEN